jgi:FMN reductase
VSTRRIAVVSAGLSQPSSTRLLADQLAEATDRALHAHDLQAQVETVELREYAHDLANNLLTGFPADRLRTAMQSVASADGLIAVTPIFTASFSGLFKTFFDVLEHDSLVGKPVLLGATGGTPRHSLALEHGVRPLFAYLRSLVVPTSVYAASEDWGTGGTAAHALADRVERAADELARLVADRPRPAAPDPFDDPTPFEDLLTGR